MFFFIIILGQEWPKSEGFQESAPLPYQGVQARGTHQEGLSFALSSAKLFYQLSVIVAAVLGLIFR